MFGLLFIRCLLEMRCLFEILKKLMKWKIWLLILVVLWGLGFLIRESLSLYSQDTILQKIRNFEVIDQGDFEIKVGLDYLFDWKVITGNIIFSGEKNETRLKSDFSFSFKQKRKGDCRECFIFLRWKNI